MPKRKLDTSTNKDESKKQKTQAVLTENNNNSNQVAAPTPASYVTQPESRITMEADASKLNMKTFLNLLKNAIIKNSDETADITTLLHSRLQNRDSNIKNIHKLLQVCNPIFDATNIHSCIRQAIILEKWNYVDLMVNKLEETLEKRTKKRGSAVYEGKTIAASEIFFRVSSTLTYSQNAAFLKRYKININENYSFNSNTQRLVDYLSTLNKESPISLLAYLIPCLPFAEYKIYVEKYNIEIEHIAKVEDEQVELVSLLIQKHSSSPEDLQPYFDYHNKIIREQMFDMAIEQNAPKKMIQFFLNQGFSFLDFDNLSELELARIYTNYGLLENLKACLNDLKLKPNIFAQLKGNSNPVFLICGTPHFDKEFLDVLIFIKKEYPQFFNQKELIFSIVSLAILLTSYNETQSFLMPAYNFVIEECKLNGTLQNYSTKDWSSLFTKLYIRASTEPTKENLSFQILKLLIDIVPSEMKENNQTYTGYSLLYRWFIHLEAQYINYFKRSSLWMPQILLQLVEKNLDLKKAYEIALNFIITNLAPMSTLEVFNLPGLHEKLSDNDLMQLSLDHIAKTSNSAVHLHLINLLHARNVTPEYYWNFFQRFVSTYYTYIKNPRSAALEFPKEILVRIAEISKKHLESLNVFVESTPNNFFSFIALVCLQTEKLNQKKWKIFQDIERYFLEDDSYRVFMQEARVHAQKKIQKKNKTLTTIHADKQSTHRAAVHGSAGESARKLWVHYFSEPALAKYALLSAEEKQNNPQKKWTDKYIYGQFAKVLHKIYEYFRTQALASAREKLSGQVKLDYEAKTLNKFEDLSSSQQEFMIDSYCNFLYDALGSGDFTQNHHSNNKIFWTSSSFIAWRWLNKIYNDEYYCKFVDSNSGLNLNQATGCIFQAIHDNELYDKEDQARLLRILEEHFVGMCRNKNSDLYGNDPDSSICNSGAFNETISTLDHQHKLVVIEQDSKANLLNYFVDFYDEIFNSLPSIDKKKVFQNSKEEIDKNFIKENIEKFVAQMLPKIEKGYFKNEDIAAIWSNDDNPLYVEYFSDTYRYFKFIECLILFYEKKFAGLKPEEKEMIIRESNQNKTVHVEFIEKYKAEFLQSIDDKESLFSSINHYIKKNTETQTDMSAQYFSQTDANKFLKDEDFSLAYFTSIAEYQADNTLLLKPEAVGGVSDSRSETNHTITKSGLSFFGTSASGNFDMVLKQMVQSWGNRTSNSHPVEIKSFSLTSSNFQEYECHNVPGDGNCFFHAVLDQLTKLNLHKDYTHVKLREMAVNYVLENTIHYCSFVPKEMNTFIGEIVEVGTWADHVIIDALSKALKINITIVRPNDDKNNFTVASADKTLKLGYTGNHYISLVDRPNSKLSVSNSLS